MELLPRLGPGSGISTDGKRRIWKGIRLRTDEDIISDKSDKIRQFDKIIPQNQEIPLIKEKPQKFIKTTKVLSETSKNVRR